MNIAETYSHLNGLEFLLVHKPLLWEKIRSVIADADAANCRTKVSKEKIKKGRLLYSPIDINAIFMRLLRARDWDESRVAYWVTRSEKLIRQTLSLSPNEQKLEIEAAGEIPIFSYNPTDFVKDRVAVEVQFGKYAFVAYDLFVKHLAFYVRDQIRCRNRDSAHEKIAKGDEFRGRLLRRGTVQRDSPRSWGSRRAVGSHRC